LDRKALGLSGQELLPRSHLDLIFVGSKTCALCVELVGRLWFLAFLFGLSQPSSLNLLNFTKSTIEIEAHLASPTYGKNKNRNECDLGKCEVLLCWVFLRTSYFFRACFHVTILYFNKLLNSHCNVYKLLLDLDSELPVILFIFIFIRNKLGHLEYINSHQHTANYLRTC